MPLCLHSLDFTLICDGNELELYDVKQDHSNSMRAFVASEAGKQFKITVINNLSDTGLALDLYIDGGLIDESFIEAGEQYEIAGIRKSSTSVLPFKFQELELVDSDMENAPVVPEMGTIELRAFRCQSLSDEEFYIKECDGLHQGHVSERTKMAGWHQVSTGDEVFTDEIHSAAVSDCLDPPDAPYVSVKIFYRPRELLMAQGVITGHGLGAKSNRGPEVNNRKRVREGGSPGPSKRCPGSTVKKEEISSNAHAQRIQALQGQIQALQAELNSELNALMAEQSGSSVKREPRSPSPIVVGQATGGLVDLTLEE